MYGIFLIVFSRVIAVERFILHCKSYPSIKMSQSTSNFSIVLQN